MNIKQRLYPLISHGAKAVAFVLLMLVTACGAQEDPDVEKEEDKLQLSDQEITLGVHGWKPMAESRANIFETENDFLYESAGKGGGYFTLHAYMRETGNTFIGGAKVWYYTLGQTPAWRFLSGNDLIDYYWPQNGSVDFFAYMPWRDNEKHIKSISYSEGKVTLGCQMQSTTANNDDDTKNDLDDLLGQETIIAYTTNKSKADGSVNMHFVHPFSAVYFDLKQAHRDLTIKWIRFNNVYLKGSATLDTTTLSNTKITWISNGNKETFNIPVGMTIPDEINFGGDIGGPYLVMPQSLDDVTVTINYEWNNAKDKDDKIEGDANYDAENEDSELNKNGIYEITRKISTSKVQDIEKAGEWIAGNKYTYILDLGDNDAEILFKVLVEPWGVEGYKHIIDVE